MTTRFRSFGAPLANAARAGANLADAQTFLAVALASSGEFEESAEVLRTFAAARLRSPGNVGALQAQAVLAATDDGVAADSQGILYLWWQAGVVPGTATVTAIAPTGYVTTTTPAIATCTITP